MSAKERLVQGLVSDGSTASYYELPKNCAELQDLISHRNMNSQIGEIFRACYRYGQAAHSDMLRDAKKIKFYAEAEVKRLEALKPAPEPKSERALYAEEAAKSMQTAAAKNMARKNSLSNLLTYQGLTVPQIVAALASRGYNAHGLDEDLRWLVSNGIAYYNSVGSVWCRAKL